MLLLSRRVEVVQYLIGFGIGVFIVFIIGTVVMVVKMLRKSSLEEAEQRPRAW